MALRVGEDYVRPPLVPREPSSTARATWRFRFGGLVVLGLIVWLLVVLFLRFSGIGTEDPGLSGGLTVPRPLQVSAAP